MDNDKSIIAKISDTIKAAAESIANPTAGTPMDMPLSETGATLIRKKHVQNIVNAAAKKPAKKRAVKAAANKTKSSAGRKAVGKNKKTVLKAAAKKRSVR